MSPCTKSVTLITILWIRNTCSLASFPLTTPVNSCLYHLFSSPFLKKYVKTEVYFIPSTCSRMFITCTTDLSVSASILSCIQRIVNETSPPPHPSLKVAPRADLMQTTCRACVWWYWLYITLCLFLPGLPLGEVKWGWQQPFASCSTSQRASACSIQIYGFVLVCQTGFIGGDNVQIWWRTCLVEGGTKVHTDPARGGCKVPARL